MDTLADVASVVNDGDVVAFAGKTLHRAPAAFVRELVRQDKRELTLIGVANSIDIDLLCGAGCARAVHFGYVGFEALGLAPNFRRAVETDRVSALEGTCYTVAAMLRGAKQGVPFMPIAGLDGSDLAAVRHDFEPVESPFGDESVYAVRTIQPDVGVIHATETDHVGNARFYGADLTENLVAKAADRVVVTTERVVDTDTFEDAPATTKIPGVLVDAVVEVPFGAHPCSCPGEYDYDREHLEQYIAWSADGEFTRYIETFLGPDEAAYREHVGIDRREALEWAKADVEAPS